MASQTLVDDISAAVYNVVFTSLPISLCAALEFETMVQYPQTYNRSTAFDRSSSGRWRLHVRSETLLIHPAALLMHPVPSPSL
jgi:hypothetical protein